MYTGYFTELTARGLGPSKLNHITEPFYRMEIVSKDILTIKGKITPRRRNETQCCNSLLS